MEIKKYKPSNHKVKAVVYGASGCGKTTFGASAPKPIFASAEGGLLSVAHLNPDYVEIKTLKDLSELYKHLKEEKHDFETVIIDSITEINEIIKIDIEKKTGKQMTIKDWGTLGKKIKSILRQFRDLDMHVLFICQEKTDKDEDKIHKILPSLNGKADTEIAYFMDIVGYLRIDKKGDRHMITQPNSRLLTKDRTNKIGNDADVNLSSWVELVKNIKIEKIPEKAKKAEPKKEVSTAETKAETPKKEEKTPAKKEVKKVVQTDSELEAELTASHEDEEKSTAENAKDVFTPNRTELQDYCLEKVGYDKTKDRSKYTKKATEYIEEKFKEMICLKTVDEEKAKLLFESLVAMNQKELLEKTPLSPLEKKITETTTEEEIFALKKEVQDLKLSDRNEYHKLATVWLDKRKELKK